MSAITIDPQIVQDETVEEESSESYWLREFNFGDEDMDVKSLFLAHKLEAESVDPNEIVMNFHIPTGTMVLDAHGIQYSDETWDSFFAIDNITSGSDDEPEDSVDEE